VVSRSRQKVQSDLIDGTSGMTRPNRRHSIPYLV
jgi:hypothetical protein